MRFHINPDTDVPKYKQVLSEIETRILDGTLKKGTHLPSMTDIATDTGMSKETVKRALVTLRNKGYIASCPGKGYYVSRDADEIPKKLNILMILGRMDIFKQLLVDSFTNALVDEAEVKIILHNADVDQLEHYLDQYLDTYDYYVVSPHFSIDDQTQMRVAKLLGRVPNRKLLLLDHCNRFMSGQFGAVYQDFFTDVERGLEEAVDELRNIGCLNAVVLPTSRYGKWVLEGVGSFCARNHIPLRVMDSFPRKVKAGEVFLLQTGQLSNELAEFDEILKENNLTVGVDVGLIAYNDVPLNSVVLGGLTTISTDFVKMGKLAAEMVLSRKMTKIHNEFRIIRRNTF